MSTRGVKYEFVTGEQVLCFEPDSSKAKVLYDAKILDISVSMDKKGKRKPSYLIHFLGWNNSWDRVVPESFLLRNTDENRVLMKKLEVISHRVKSNKLRMKKIDSVLKKFFRSNKETPSCKDGDGGDDDDFSGSGDEEDDDDEDNDDDVDMLDDDSVVAATEDSISTTTEAAATSEYESDENECVKYEPVCLDLPEPLKRKLERDCYLIKRQNKRLKLPAVPNVVTVLEGYLKCFAVNMLCASTEKQRLQHHLRSQKQQAPDKSIQLCKEMVDGLRIIFDFTLPLCLLYDSENVQYTEVMQQVLLKQKAAKMGVLDSPLDGKKSKSSASDPNSSRQRRQDILPSHDIAGSNDSDDGNSTFSDARPVVKKEATYDLPSRRVTRNSSGMREPAGGQTASRLSRSPARGGVLKSGFVERQEDSTEEHTPRRPERETRQSYGRTRLGSLSCDPLSAGDGVNVRASLQLRGSPAVAVRPEPLEPTTAQPPCLRFESEPSEASSQVSCLLSSHPELKAAYSQKEKEVSSVFAWKLIPEEMRSGVSNSPSLVYGAHHLLRLFVTLPDILTQMEIPANVQIQLIRHVQLLIDHFNSQCEALFPESSYTN